MSSDDVEPVTLMPNSTASIPSLGWRPALGSKLQSARRQTFKKHKHEFNR